MNFSESYLTPASAFSAMTGEVDRPVAVALLVPSVIECQSDRLWYAEPFRDTVAGKGLLEGFLRLGTGSIDEIAAYARRWGVLGICRHGLPATHRRWSQPQTQLTSPYAMLRAAAAAKPRRAKAVLDFVDELKPALASWENHLAPCQPLGWDPADRDNLPDRALGWEPTEIWRQFSRQAMAILRVADRLKNRKTGDSEDWRYIFQASGEGAPWWERHVDVERLILARVINEWLVIGDTRPSIIWSSPAVDVRLVSRSLFGALAIQLAFNVSSSEGLVACSGCGRSYSPGGSLERRRRPKTGQRNYCQACRRRGIPGRDAKRDYDARRRNS